jgi:diguanylate cyclase (GGDEF)-like protein
VAHATILLAVIFGNISLKPRFPFAVGSSIALLVGYAAILPFCRLDPHLWGFLFSTVLSATLFTLMANYSLEEEYRRGYLLTLRERLRQAGLQEENHTLSELASLDPLTNLANRREFDARLETLLREPTMLSLVMIDVDHFKGYNDIHGHQAGDKCLQMISRVLQELTRGRRDIAARFGGEEFVLLLPDSDLSTACQVAERIRTSIAQLGIHHGDSPVSSVVTISAGVATSRPESTSGDIVARADAALYKAKSEGRNRVCPERQPQPIG